jgi:hypothetical protein
MSTCKQALHADLELHFPFGVNLQQRVSGLSTCGIVVFLITLAVLGIKRESMS